MYEQVFNFNSRPFTTSPYVKHYYPASAIHQALGQSKICIDRASGPVVAIGGVGTGKSLFLAMLESDYRDQFWAINLACSRLQSRKELLQNILFQMGQPVQGGEEAELRLQILDKLRPSDECPNGMLLLVDDVDGVDVEILDEMRLLMNFVVEGVPRVRLVLAGQRKLEDLLTEPSLASFSQRIASRVFLENLSRDDTGGYIVEHVNRVGGNGPQLFPFETQDVVQRLTDGCPRQINQVCDFALILAGTRGETTVTPELMEEAWADVQSLPGAISAGPKTATVSGPVDAEASGDDDWTVIEFGQLDDEPSAGATVYDFSNDSSSANDTPQASEMSIETAAAETSLVDDSLVESAAEPIPVESAAEPEGIAADGQVSTPSSVDPASSTVDPASSTVDPASSTVDPELGVDLSALVAMQNEHQKNVAAAESGNEVEPTLAAVQSETETKSSADQTVQETAANLEKEAAERAAMAAELAAVFGGGVADTTPAETKSAETKSAETKSANTETPAENGEPVVAETPVDQVPVVQTPTVQTENAAFKPASSVLETSQIKSAAEGTIEAEESSNSSAESSSEKQAVAEPTVAEVGQAVARENSFTSLDFASAAGSADDRLSATAGGFSPVDNRFPAASVEVPDEPETEATEQKAELESIVELDSGANSSDPVTKFAGPLGFSPVSGAPVSPVRVPVETDKPAEQEVAEASAEDVAAEGQAAIPDAGNAVDQSTLTVTDSETPVAQQPLQEDPFKQAWQHEEAVAERFVEEVVSQNKNALNISSEHLQFVKPLDDGAADSAASSTTDELTAGIESNDVVSETVTSETVTSDDVTPSVMAEGDPSQSTEHQDPATLSFPEPPAAETANLAASTAPEPTVAKPAEKPIKRGFTIKPAGGFKAVAKPAEPAPGLFPAASQAEPTPAEPTPAEPTPVAVEPVHAEPAAVDPAIVENHVVEPAHSQRDAAVNDADPAAVQAETNVADKPQEPKMRPAHQDRASSAEISRKADEILRRLEQNAAAQSQQSHVPAPSAPAPSPTADAEANVEPEPDQQILNEIRQQQTLLHDAQTAHADDDPISSGSGQFSLPADAAASIPYPHAEPVVEANVSENQNQEPQPHQDDSEMLVVEQAAAPVDAEKVEPKVAPSNQNPISTGNAKRMDYERLFDRLRNLPDTGD